METGFVGEEEYMNRERMEGCPQSTGQLMSPSRLFPKTSESASLFKLCNSDIFRETYTVLVGLLILKLLKIIYEIIAKSLS